MNSNSKAFISGLVIGAFVTMYGMLATCNRLQEERDLARAREATNEQTIRQLCDRYNDLRARTIGD